MESLGLNDTGSVRLSAPLASLDQTFLLNSNPWASTTIYLDFDGHTTTGTAWNNSTMGSSFSSPAFSLDTDRSSFSSSELTRIQQVWQRVSADFSCFDVNVTTQAPPVDWLIKNNSTDPFYGVRVVITNYGPSSGSAGGIAYINSFSWDSDTPAFVYNTSLLGVSEAISHEVGHTLGLSHDGSFDGTTTVGYYQGHGSGENGWAPIMGVGYYKSVTTWDNGIYYISNNGGSTANYNKGADDLAILSSNLGVAPQQDQEGNSPQTATPLILTAGTASQYGTIQTAADTDWYQFQLLNAGDLNLQFNPYVYSSYIDDDGTWGGSFTPYFSSVSDAVANTSWADNGTNLDLSVDLLNNEGTVVASSNPAGLAASLTLSGLPAGLYYLRLDGTGYGDPTQSSPTGYSDYASIGSYLISGTITNSEPLPVVSLAGEWLQVQEDGDSNLVFTFSRSDAGVDPLTVSFSIAGSATAGSDYASLPSSITFAPGALTASLIVDPIADSSVEADETVSLSLLPGSGYLLSSALPVTGTITNDDLPPKLLFTAGIDTLTGTSSSDTFQLVNLKDALLGSGTPDKILGLQAGVDRIDTPLPRTTAISPRQLGAVTALTSTAIASVLTTRQFPKDGAATFTFGSGSSLRTFLALNDASSGFVASNDAVIEITGYSGSLGALAIL
ncbi:MAG: bluetail domain-containing putative surface protein [Cyanobacteriota bacterium]